MQRLVDSGDLFSSGFEQTTEDLWEEEIRKEASNAAQVGDLDLWGPPHGWPRFFLKEAQLIDTMGQLRGLVPRPAEGVQFITETTLRDPNSPLYGTPDLVVRSPDWHAVLDLKSGTAREPGFDLPKEGYEQQLRIYTYLEAGESGAWPEHGYLVGFGEAPIPVGVGETETMLVVSAALDAIAAYNDELDGWPTPTPGSGVCRQCIVAPECDVFWAQSGPLSAGGLHSLKAVVVEVTETPLGGVAIDLAPLAGVPDPPLRLNGLNPRLHVRGPMPLSGDQVAVIGLGKHTNSEGATSWGVRPDTRIIGGDPLEGTA